MKQWTRMARTTTRLTAVLTIALVVGTMTGSGSRAGHDNQGPGNQEPSHQGPEPCPIEALRAMLSPADPARGGEFVDHVAVETEALRLCVNRQRLIRTLYDQDAQIRVLRAGAAAGETASGTTSTPAALPPGEGWNTTGSGIGAVLATGADIPNELPHASSAAVPEDTTPTSPSSPQAPLSVPFTWFSISGTGDDLTAGVSRGDLTWFVKTGDPLPEGTVLSVISARPPQVIITRSGGTHSLGFESRHGNPPQ